MDESLVKREREKNESEGLSKKRRRDSCSFYVQQVRACREFSNKVIVNVLLLVLERVLAGKFPVAHRTGADLFVGHCRRR